MERKIHSTPSAIIQQAVKDSQLLITYAAQHRLNLDRDTVTTLIDAKNALQQDSWSAKQEVAFWQAFTNINQSVKPVSIESLKAVLPSNERFSLSSLTTKARFSVHLYRVFTACTLLLLIVSQVYWLIGSGLISEIDILLEEKQQVAETTNTGATNVEREQTKDVESKPGESLQQQSGSVKDSMNLPDKDIATNYNGLLDWGRLWQKAFNVEDKFEGKTVLLNQEFVQEKIYRLQRRIETNKRLLDFGIGKTQQVDIEQRQQKQEELWGELEAEKIEYERVITKTSSEFVLEILQNYILPFLYGLLGAAIYVLRSLTKEIERVTYTGSDDIEYGLRLALGALGGLAIGWFLTPKDISGFQSISPLALSFLVGYNIDLLFTGMDKFIDAFSQSRLPSSSKK